MKIIDIFAGPGGLGEGFSTRGFDVSISIEKEKIECETLKFRKFFHDTYRECSNTEYVDFMRGKLTKNDLVQKNPAKWEACETKVKQFELGEAPFTEVQEAINKAIGKKATPTIVVGGPPCQAYSVAGRSRRIGSNLLERDPSSLGKFYADKRHFLYQEYLKILAANEPDAFVMENVKGILTAKLSPDSNRGSVINQILEDIKCPWTACSAGQAGIQFQNELEQLGTIPNGHTYELFPLAAKEAHELLDNKIEPRDFIIQCENFGIPQSRHRVIILGIRSDHVKNKGKPRQLVPHIEKVPVRTVLNGLPPVRSRITRPKEANEEWLACVGNEIGNLTNLKPQLQQKAKIGGYPSVKVTNKANSELMHFILDSSRYTTSHITRSHMLSDLARYYFCAEYGEQHAKSPRINDWPTYKGLQPAHKNVRLNGEKLHTTAFNDRFKVQIENRPSSTVTSHISKDGHYFIHPDKTQCRSFTVREAARIQTFPDNYYFCGGISKQFHQVGNAVPPYLAFQIADILWDYFDMGDHNKLSNVAKRK